jgi:hypothetical protein
VEYFWLSFISFHIVSPIWVEPDEYQDKQPVINARTELIKCMNPVIPLTMFSILLISYPPLCPKQKADVVNILSP